MSHFRRKSCIYVIYVRRIYPSIKDLLNSEIRVDFFEPLDLGDQGLRLIDNG